MPSASFASSNCFAINTREALSGLLGSARLGNAQGPPRDRALSGRTASRSAAPNRSRWLKQRARERWKGRPERSSFLRVIVVGYYCLARGLCHEKTPGSIRRNMPTLFRCGSRPLAVHTDWQNRAQTQSYERALARRIRALLAHALNDDAKRFYLHYGFVESPIERLTVMLNIAKLAQAK
jgi:hypothetical protein